MTLKFKKIFHKNNGFTLIELLVVISIISLLASVMLVALNNTRIKARDVKRLADLKQIYNALELYYSDNGHYPNTNDSWSCFDCVPYISTAVINPNAASIAAALLPYMSGSPKDPKNLGGDSGYLYTSGNNGKDYKLIAWRTPENINNYNVSVIDYFRCSAWNSGGQCTAGYLGGNNTVGFWSPGGINY